MKLHIYAILFLTAAIINCQNASEAKPLALNQSLEITLAAEQAYVFSIELPSNLTSNKDLFLMVEWPANDPLQNPFIDIYVDQLQFNCYNSNDDFSGVCRVPSQQLKVNSSVKASVFCYIECKLKLLPTLSNKLQMSVTDTLIFTASPSNNLPLEIQIPIPSTLNFTQIAIYAQIQSILKASSGLEMYANVGDEKKAFPTKGDYFSIGQSMFFGGKGIFLSQQEVRGGQWIKLYLYLGEGMSIKLSASVINGNVFSIDLGKSYFDFTSPSQDKLYVLDLSKKAKQIDNKTLEFTFIVYSGSPYVSIATDIEFLNLLNPKNLASTSTYLITPSIRTQYNFTGRIYIKVSSYWSCDYFFSTNVDSRNYMSILPDISIYNQLQPNQIFNYFFQDIVYIQPNATTMRTYSLRIDMQKGNNIFGIRRCKTAQSGKSVLGCVINDKSQTSKSSVKSSFQEIELTLKSTDTDYYLIFSIDASKCALIANLSYYCSFHIVALESNNSTSDYTITLNKRIYTSLLREGQLTRDFIYKDQYLFYRFSISSLEDIVSITFYTTVIEGDIYLLGSTTDQYPTLETDIKNLFISFTNAITIYKDKLNKITYISIFANEFSQFTLGVKVVRKAKDNTTNSTSINQTKLTLKLDISQQFSFQENDTSATFLISTQSTMNVSTQVMQLSGTVTLSISDGEGKAVNCIESSISNYKIICTFTAVQKTTYSALINAKKGETQRFVILYHKTDNCITYYLNNPLYLAAKSNQTVCAKYSLTKLAQLQVTTNAPLSYLVDESLKMVVCLNDNCLLPTMSHHQLITKNQINTYCKLSKDKNSSNTMQSCSIRVQFTSKSSLQFAVIVEQSGKDIGLLDGVVQKVSSYDLSHQNGKYFYYPIEDRSTIQIYFTSLTSDSYYIALHFVQNDIYLGNDTVIYLPYKDSSYYDLKDRFETNFYENVFYGSYTNIITISSTKFQQYCKECILTISVYPRYTYQRKLYSFEIEVTQTETTLFLGSSKIGFLEADQIYNYQLEDNKNSDSILSIKDVSKQSSSKQSCYQAVLSSSTNQQRKLEGGLAYITKGQSLSNLYVYGKSSFCNYEITYISVDVPLMVVTKGRSYKIERNKVTKIYLLHTHSTNSAFNIIQIINAGSLKVYATPITSNQSLSQLLTNNLSSYAYINSDFDGQFLIKNTSKDFCFNCQYLIALQTSEAINAQIIIADFNSSIPLSVNGIIKQKIIKGELSTRNYTFNTISAFNLTVSPIYGKVTVVVLDPSKNVIVNQTISNTEILIIPHNKKTENYSYDYSSYETRFAINVECSKDCSYTIKASRQNSSYRIFAGIPFYYYFDSNQTITLEFLNLNGATASSNSLNILIDIIDYQQKVKPNISAIASFENKEGATPLNIPITSFTQSQDSFNLEIPLRVGTYYLKISAASSIYCSLLLVKQSLIHLKPSSTAVMFKEAIFELYSKEQNAVVQIFTCYGDIRIDASQNYNDLLSSATGSKQIVLEQTNYGGHFILHTEQTYGEYFIKIGNRKKQAAQLGYLINYHYYSKEDVSPYKLIDLVDRQISYTLTQSSIVFSFEPVTINWNLTESIEDVLEQYILYIADSKIKVSQFMNCKLGEIAKFYASEEDIDEDRVRISVEISKIKDIVGDKQNYFVGVEARAYLQSSDEDYPDELKLIYEIIQLNNMRMPASAQNPQSSYSPQTIIVWFLLPFGIAGIILYFSLKYFIKKYRGFIPNQLIEEGQGESQQGVNLPDGSPYSANNNASQSIKDEV